MSKFPRYFLHISSIENRSSILKNGLIPKSILKSKQFKLDHRNNLKKVYDDKKCIFMTPFKDEIDFYDIKEIRRYVFPLPLISNGLSNEEYEDLVEKAFKNIDFFKKLEQIKKDVAEKFRAESYASLEQDFDNELNRLCIENSKEFDIWIIDTAIQKISPKEDRAGITDFIDSFYVTEKISNKALTLIKGDTQYRKYDFKFENKIPSFNEWLLLEKFK